MKAQILSKKQLSSVRGGQAWQCKVVQEIREFDGEIILVGPIETIIADSAIEAADHLHAKYGVDQINCTAN